MLVSAGTAEMRSMLVPSGISGIKSMLVSEAAFHSIKPLISCSDGNVSSQNSTFRLSMTLRDFLKKVEFPSFLCL